jgi:hypothetical protein
MRRAFLARPVALRGIPAKAPNRLTHRPSTAAGSSAAENEPFAVTVQSKHPVRK